VHPHAVNVGAVQQGLVRRGIVALDPLDQLILTQITAGALARLVADGGGVGRKEGFGDREGVLDRLEDVELCARGRQ